MRRHVPIALCIVSIGAILVFFGIGRQTSDTLPVAVPTPSATRTTPTEVSRVRITENRFTGPNGQGHGDFWFRGIDEAKVATYAGEAVIMGSYFRSEPDGNICFTPGEESAGRIPDVREYETDPWFCFSNRQFAEEQLGIDGGTATVVVQGYTDMTADTSKPATTELVSVVTSTRTLAR